MNFTFCHDPTEDQYWTRNILLLCNATQSNTTTTALLHDEKPKAVTSFSVVLHQLSLGVLCLYCVLCSSLCETCSSRWSSLQLVNLPVLSPSPLLMWSWDVGCNSFEEHISSFVATTAMLYLLNTA